MAHIAHRPTPARRLFSYSDAEMARRDQEQEDRCNTPRERLSCTQCLDRGCPACWGNEEYEQEEE